MVDLVPVEGDPFADAAQPPAAFPSLAASGSSPGLTPVEGDPFKVSALTPEPIAPKLQAVEGNPFGTLEKVPQTEAPGILGTALEAGKRGFLEAGQQVAATASAVSAGTLEGQPDPSQQANDAVGKLLEAKISSGWLDPKWWAAQMAHGLAGSSPMLAGGVAGAVGGGALGGPPGAIAGGAGGAIAGSVAQTLVPVYQRERALGKSPDDAFDLAWKETAISGTVAGLMGGTAGIQFLRAPIKNAVLQLFGVQPSIATGGQAAITALEGKDITPDDLATGFAVNVALGVPFVGAHALVRPKASVSDPGASPEAIRQTLEAVTPKAEQGTGVQLSEVAPLSDTFYSVVRKVAEDKLPNVASPEQILGTLRNAEGVKPEEISALGLDQWLGRQVGKVAKRDVIAEIEANAIRVQDVVHQENPLPDLRWVKTGEATWDTSNAPGWKVEQDVGQGSFNRGTFAAVDPQGHVQGRFATIEAAQGEIVRQVRGPNTTQYRDYTLPGGENYREHLMTLPSETGIKPREGFSSTEAAQAWNTKARQDYRGPHFEEPNILAHFRTTDRTDAEGKRVLFVEEIQSDWHQTGRKAGYGNSTKQAGSFTNPIGSVPEASFKTSWPELAFKRILRLAADEGYDRVAWTPGSVQAERYGLDARAARGQSDFYDKMIPQIADKWARKLGTKTGMTVLPDTMSGIREGKYPVNPRYIDIPQEAATRIQRGLPLFSEKAGGVTLESSVPREARTVNGRDLVPAARQAALALGEIARSMEIRTPITVRLVSSLRGSLGMFEYDHVGGRPIRYMISLAIQDHATPEAIYATAAHEFGHLIKFERFDSAPVSTQLAIQSAYERFRESVSGNVTFADVIARRDNFISMTQDMRAIRGRDYSIYAMSPERRQYWLSFDEWMAEQVARWATTAEKPLNVVDRFFSALGQRLRSLYETFRSRFGLLGEPDKFVADWLNSLVKEPSITSFDVIRAMEDRTRAQNQAAFISDGSPYVDAEPQTSATVLGWTVMHSLGVNDSAARAMAAGADRFNKFYNLMVSMVQVADRNPHIEPLQRYRELWQVKQNERAEIMNESLETLKAWRRLGRGPGDKLAGLIDDYMNLRYMTDAEHAQGVRRRPTPAEFAKLVKDNGVNDSGLQVFRRVVSDFDRMLGRYEEILKLAAVKITDPRLQAEKLASIAEQIARFRQQPYFPAMRFGDFTLTVRDAAGKVMHFETFEKARTRDSALKEIQGKLKPGEAVQVGVLAKDAAPMLGLPPGLLDSMAEKLALSPSQRQSLEQLRFEMAPAQSFKHRFQRKNRVEGYSTDFMRAYANYFFHGSNYFTKVKYIDALREQVGAVRESAKELVDSTKRGQISNFLSDHLAYMMDPKPDFAALRSMMFTWALGFSPAAAALNLSQMLMGSYPFLASKFGDVRAVAAMGRAGTKFSTYYKKATLAGSGERDLRAISEAVKEGVISEAQAAELAAVSEGRNLGKGFGGTHTEQLLNRFNEASSWMFEMTEQTNRRVTFRAAWDLASEHPEAKYVQEMVQKHALQYQRLRDKGWTERDAAAFVAAKDATEATQFVYQQYAQPRFMRGKLRTVFIFKSFLQNTLFMLWNYPTAAVRSMLVMGALGGLMGVPGSEDLRGILKALAWRLFGKDFDLEDEARKLVVDITSGKVRPDLVLHGMSRIGFGIPSVMNMLGVPLPQFDMSKSIGLGQISPVDVGQLLGPAGTGDPSKAIAQQTQRASGAAFGVGFNIYKALTDGQLDWNDFKRWQSAMPRELGALTKSYRAFSEGQERNRTGNTVVRFDVNDPQQMMEVLGMAAGFNPTRLSAQWDRIIAEREAVQYWDLRKQGLLRQAWNARKTGDTESWKQIVGAIQKFNADLPKEARMKAITADMIRESFTARARAANAQESGVPTQRSNIPIVREIQRIYPEAEVDVRRVR